MLAKTTLNTFVAGFQVGGKVDGARSHLAQVLIRDDEMAGLAAGALGAEVGQDVDRAADRAVAATGAASGLHASVHGRRDDDHPVMSTAGIKRLPLTELAEHHAAATAALQFYIIPQIY